MNIADSFGSSVQNIITHPLRSIMTLMAIVIGIFAVVVMFSSVYGIKTIVKTSVESMGLNNSIWIYPSQALPRRSGHSGNGFQAAPRIPKPLDYQDYLSLKNNVEHKHLYGVIEQWYQNSSFSQDESIRLVATNDAFFASKNYYIKEGRTFNDFEIRHSAKVCLLGSGLVAKYFDDNNIVGDRIVLGNNVFVVIGTIDEDKTQSTVFHFNQWERNRELNSVYVPLTTGLNHLKADKSVDYLSISSFDSESYRNMMNRTRQTLLANHSMAHNFSFQDIGSHIANLTEEMDKYMGKWNITLTAIASISLLVGGLGLFSTMLISIGERLLEIGIRKCVGASPSDIFIHYLLESLLFSLLGALLGIGLSVGLIKVASSALNFSFPIVYTGIFIGIGFAVIIGLLAGLYPAFKAADIDPIRAIYYNE